MVNALSSSLTASKKNKASDNSKTFTLYSSNSSNKIAVPQISNDILQYANNYSLSSAQALDIYKEMLLIRRFEERAGQLYGMGIIGGFCHLYIGQEAVVVGSMRASINGDAVITSYRDHGHILACGISPNLVMAELAGRRSGISKGKGGSMHMFAKEKHFYGGHGIVGAQVSIGTGVAFANKYKGNNNVCLTYFGDGAANQGQVYESYNMASLWKLPVLYIVENNQYAMGTSVSRSSAEADFAKRGLAFDIPGIKVDGMDVQQVYKATSAALDYIRQGNGPVILDMETYRYRGHSMSDPANYRAKEELETMRSQHDPLEQMKARLIEGAIADEAELKDIDKKLRALVAEAAKFAQQEPEPSIDELYSDILV